MNRNLKSEVNFLGKQTQIHSLPPLTSIKYQLLCHWLPEQTATRKYYVRPNQQLIFEVGGLYHRLPQALDPPTTL